MRRGAIQRWRGESSAGDGLVFGSIELGERRKPGRAQSGLVLGYRYTWMNQKKEERGIGIQGGRDLR